SDNIPFENSPLKQHENNSTLYLKKFKDNMISVANEQYSETPGLIELLFNKTPNVSLISDTDKKNYLKIINSTNTLYKRYDPDGSLMLDKGVDKNSYRGPPGYGFKVTTDGQYDMANKRLCNVASPKDANDAVSFGTMMTTINHELERIKQSIASIRNDVDVQKKNVSTMRNNFDIQKKYCIYTP
ncbi:hypothetical protein PV328_012287, partial [Microctonus aethiopoides]